MNKLRLAFRKLARARFFFILSLVGLLFVAAGTVTLIQSKNSKYITADATITGITETYNAVTEEYDHSVTIRYTDENGQEHEVPYGGYSSSWEKGTVIRIKYDPNDFENVTDDTAFGKIMPYILLGVGVVALGAGAVKSALILKTPASETDECNQVDPSSFTPEQKESVRHDRSEEKEYFFHFTRKLKQGYVLETPDHEPVYEAVSLRVGILTKYQFDFLDHRTGRKETREVTHTITTETGEGNFSVVTGSRFRIDGTDCWKLLASLGYSVEPRLEGLAYDYEVKKYGEKAASVVTAGTNVMSEKQHKLGNLAVPGIYRVSCRPEDVKEIFLVCFVLARTERE